MRHSSILALLLIFSVKLALAAEKPAGKPAEDETKVITGMSIVGNNETPKSLYIVPWKTSNIKRSADFSFSDLNEEVKPVDKGEFVRELDLYRMNNSN